MGKKDGVTKILFVCLGNICRSPAAEEIFRVKAGEAGVLEKFHIDSAGLNGYHDGEEADRRMKKHASLRGYKLTSRSRCVEAKDTLEMDILVAMTEDIYEALCRASGKAKVVKMYDYCTEHQVNEIPDPYYGGEEGFEYVMDILEDACSNMLESLK